jgi:Peptide-N-glycosidase F, C terminal
LTSWKLLVLSALIIVTGLAIALSCGDDDDDDDNDDDATDDDDTDSDDDDNNDAADDDDDDDNDTTPSEWPGPPWFGCTDEDIPGDATVVTAMDQVDHYYLGGDDRRTVDTQVVFPAAADWDQITMRVELECPADGDCDDWDRLANLYLVQQVKKGKVPTEEVVEIWRYITPYNIGMCMLADVTAFAPLLTGTQTLRSFISTWVGPGSGDGHGWRVTVKFIFHSASKSVVPDELHNVWPNAYIEVGNPDNPIASQIGDQSFTAPSTVTKAELRLLVTGHGQGNKSNCAEFCQLTQVITVNGTEFKVDPWRGDCAHNPIGPDQDGTWSFPRAGWCPGAPVLPHVFDITSAVTPDAVNDLTYTVRDSSDAVYENSCRPGAGDGDNYCEGCAFNQNPGNCDYNSGNHTQPNDQISVQVFVWE